MVTISQPGQRRIQLERIRNFWNRYKKNKAAVIGLVIVVFFTILAVFAGQIAPANPDQIFLVATYEPPSMEQNPDTGLTHIMGTDNFGRDIFSRLIYGARVSLMVGFVAAGISTFVGVVMGSVAGYFGGRVDDILMRITDIFLTIPRFFLILVIVAAFGGNIWLTMVVIGITVWPSTARLIRAEFLTFREREFTLAAIAGGASHGHIMMREILPNTAFAAIVNASLQVAGAIMTEASLSFLGLGDPTQISWGKMLQEALETLRVAWWVSTWPGVAITIVVIGFNMIGDGLNDALNPHLKER